MDTERDCERWTLREIERGRDGERSSEIVRDGH